MVFSLNTVAGFACSIGVDMGYNTNHHEKVEANPHSHSKSHSHDAAHQHKHSHKTSGVSFNNVKGSDDCCANDVASFIKLDKSIVSNNLNLQQPIFLLAFTVSYFSGNIGNPETYIKAKFPYLRRWRPPDDTDIRIAIQSFQI
jgi:ABC-type nickel/cobalt efflux system permease component RcnA